MTFKEAITILSTGSTIVASIEKIKKACANIPVGWFKPTKEKLNELQEQIQDIETYISKGFPQLRTLILVYSDLKSKVVRGRASSDKVAEIIRLSKDVTYISPIVTQIRTEHIEVKSKLNEFPVLDNEQSGQLKEQLNRIDDYIRELENIFNEIDSNKNVTTIMKLFRDISREYSKTESTLAELLNKKILQCFDI